MGQRLQHAKGRVAHGDWLPELKKAGIPVQVAQRAMRLANAGVNASPVTHLGIRRSLELLACGKDGDPMTGAEVNAVAECDVDEDRVAKVLAWMDEAKVCLKEVCPVA